MNYRIKAKIKECWRYIKNIANGISAADKQKLNQIESQFPQVFTTKETLNFIVESKLSISRYGDGEFDIMNQEKQTAMWQKPSNSLSKRLEEILATEEEGFLACIPPFNSKYNNPKCYNGKLSFWQYYWLNKFDAIAPKLGLKNYGNSFVSRDSVFYENELCNIKKIWENRNIVFVYGKGGRFNENSELFNNISNKDTVLVSPVNAFDEYTKILETCIKYPKDRLFIISAGPTATVLAYDLFKAGYQALDLGHLPNCYDQYKGQIHSPEALPRVRE